MARNPRPGSNWVKGGIVERLVPLPYLLDMENHQYWKRHTDQLKIID